MHELPGYDLLIKSSFRFPLPFTANKMQTIPGVPYISVKLLTFKAYARQVGTAYHGLRLPLWSHQRLECEREKPIQFSTFVLR